MVFLWHYSLMSKLPAFLHLISSGIPQHVRLIWYDVTNNFIVGISFSTTEKTLAEAFSQFGEVVEGMTQIPQPVELILQSIELFLA